MPAAASRRIVIVKLGGSIITRKREVERLRPKILARLACEIGAAPREGLILLHGAGSFGHPGAERWGLSKAPAGAASPADRSRGASIVQSEVRRLHGRVLSALLEARVSPISLSPSSFATNSAGLLEGFDPSLFQSTLALGATPVAFGDVVPDTAWGFSILSADTLAVELARRMHAERVIFVSDVPGILDPAVTTRRRIVEEVTPELVQRLTPAAGGTDVTGGIRAKAEAMLTIAANGADAALISGLSDKSLLRAIRGEAVYGSWARAASH
ncbi:MAG: isopentenyl phosphate kinase family protein [Thermoplasmata archaeon]|nr:isopentenyl phosphate kinase family protein [Thermoplasmata archaeon]